MKIFLQNRHRPRAKTGHLNDVYTVGGDSEGGSTSLEIVLGVARVYPDHPNV